jgi:glycosyltransferase involved in cell wall biosynthesis
VLRRILHVSNSSYQSLAKAGPSYDIFKELARGAAEYHVLGQSRTLSFSTERQDNLYLHLVPAPSSKIFSLVSYQAAYLIRKYSLDGVLCQDPVLGGVAALHSARIFRIPVMVELHTDIYFRYLRSRNPVLNAIGRAARHVLRRATRVRVTGKTLADLLERAGVPPGRMVHVPYRVDESFFEPGLVARTEARRKLDCDDELLLVSVGRFIEQKGFLELLSAFGGVASRSPSVRLLLAGGGPMEEAYRAVISRDGLAGTVRLLPWLSRGEQRELLAAADVYLQPSLPGRGEWMPRTILEAMAMGLPVVASGLGGIPDVIQDGRNGMLVQPGDIEQLCLVLLELNRHADLRGNLGDQARRDVVAHYGWEEGFERYRDALYSLDSSAGL